MKHGELLQGASTWWRMLHFCQIMHQFGAPRINVQKEVWMNFEGNRAGIGRARPEVKFAPRDVFEQILEYSVIPTFDLVIEMPGEAGVVIARRTIAPY